MTAKQLLLKHWRKDHYSPLPETPKYILDAINEALHMPLECTRIKLGREVYPFDALAVNEFFYGREYSPTNNSSIFGSIYNYEAKNPDKKFRTVKEEYKGKYFIKVIRVK
jgi:hypothetical protein